MQNAGQITDSLVVSKLKLKIRPAQMTEDQSDQGPNWTVILKTSGDAGDAGNAGETR